MINGAHVILFTPQPEAAREFLRDALGLDWVDAGGGWPIFALPSAEAAIHPGDELRHELYLMCDELDVTMAELATKGATFEGSVREAEWGRIASMVIPGGIHVGLYQPRHARPG